jgi:RNA polymerase sigma-70 factor (ECF subfamily)
MRQRWDSERDEVLVARAQEGDRRALEALLERHHDRIHGVCRRLANDPHDARDATQEALVAIVKGLPRYDGRAAFTTWAHRVATNACIDELRRRNRRPVAGLPEVEREPVGPAPGTAETVADRLDLDDALAALPEEFRLPVVLRDVGGLDYAAIGEVLDLAPGTVRSRISRGRAALARHLGNQDGAHDVTQRTTPTGRATTASEEAER